MAPILDGPDSNSNYPDWVYPDDTDNTMDTIAIPLIDIDADPALTHANYKLKRQTQPAGLVGVPRCMTRCMAAANTGHCASNADFLCLCSNRDYQFGVTQCWAAACNASLYDLALSYAATACTALGAKVVHSDNSASTNITMMPIVYSRATYHIQMIMSGLCSFVLLCAIGLGVLSCRAQARRQAMMSSATMSNPPTSKSRVSRVPRSYFPGMEPGQISTVDMGSSVDFGHMFGPTKPRRQPRFTNRLPHERPFTNRLPNEWEEWEMEPSGSGSGTQDDRRSSRFSTSSKVVTTEDGNEVRHGESIVPLNPHTPMPQTPRTVYMINAPSAVSLQPPPLELPDAPPRPHSTPPSPLNPITYAPVTAPAQ